VHKIFLCPECCAKRINGLCPDCAENLQRATIEGKKRSAQINIAIFAIVGFVGAILGVIIGPEIIGTIIGATTGHHGLPYNMMEPIAIVYTLLIAYLFAAGFLGAKVVIAYVWKRSIVAAVLVIEFLAVGGGLGGIVFAPYLLYRAYKTQGKPDIITKNINTKNIVKISAIAVIAIIAVMTVAILIFNTGGLSNTYYAAEFENAGALEFSGGNNVRVYTSYNSDYYYDATYTLNGNKLIVKYTLTDYDQPYEKTTQGSISYDKQTIVFNGYTYTKIK